MQIERIHLSEKFYVEFFDLGYCIIYDSDGGEVAKLTDQPARLFSCLAENCNRFVKNEDIVALFWGGTDGGVESTPSLISKAKRKIVDTLNTVLGREFPQCDITVKDTDLKKHPEKNPSFIRLIHHKNTKNEKEPGYKLSIDPRYIKYIHSPERTFNSKKNVHGPVSHIMFIDRPEITDAIVGEFINHADNRFIFLSGIGGIGKSELARNFAKESQAKKHFKTVVELEYRESENSDSFKDALERCNPDFIAEYSSIPNDSMYKEKEKLLASADESILVLVDNFDKPDLSFLNSLNYYTGRAKVLITTRLGINSGIEQFGHVISFDKYKKSQISFACSIFCKYANISAETDGIVRDIVGYINGHTMIAAMLGRQIYVYKHSLQELLASLEMSLRTALKIEPIRIEKDSMPKDYSSDTPYEILKNLLFKDILKREFSEVERQIFGAMLLVPGEYKNISALTTLIGDLDDRNKNCSKAKEALAMLVDLGYVHQDSMHNLHLHPLISQLVSDPELGVNDGTIAELSSNFAVHLLRNEFVAEKLAFMIQFQHSKPNCYADYDKAHASATTALNEWYGSPLLSAYFKDNIDLFNNASAKDLGWLMFLRWDGQHLQRFSQRFFDSIALQNGVSVNDAVFYEKMERIFGQQNLKMDDSQTAPYIEYLSLQHTSVNALLVGNNGLGLYLHDCDTGEDWCIVNCSEQLLPKNRYFNEKTGSVQNGKYDAARIFCCYNYLASTLILPEKILDTPVRAISPNCFVRADHSAITSIVIPQTIVFIDTAAFKDLTSLKKLHFSEGLELIGREAFFGCSSLKTICLPYSFRTIEARAFSHTPLSYVAVPLGVQIGVDFSCPKHRKTINELWEKAHMSSDKIRLTYLMAAAHYIVSSNSYYSTHFVLGQDIEIEVGEPFPPLTAILSRLRQNELETIEKHLCCQFTDVSGEYPFPDDCRIIPLNGEETDLQSFLLSSFMAMGNAKGSLEIEVIEINGIEYLMLVSVNLGNETYFFFVNDNDPLDFVIRKLLIEQGQECFVGLDSDEEFDHALVELIKEVIDLMMRMVANG